MRKQNIIFFIPGIMLLLGLSFYLFFISAFNNYGMSNDRFIDLLYFYEEIPPGSILFLGDSQIREDINCYPIKSTATECFNLGIDGILPLQIALQIELLKSTKPKSIVIGVSPLFFNEEINKNDDFLLFIGESKNFTANEFILSRLTIQEKEILFMNSMDKILYKRKFILPFYIGLFKEIFSPNEFRTVNGDFINPYQFTESESLETLNKKLSRSDTLLFFDYNHSSARQKESLEYIIKNLQMSHINVIILQLPPNPLIIERIDKESMEEYHDYLSKVADEHNISLIDLENNFTTKEFNDLTHLNQKGRNRLSLNIGRGDYNII